MTALLAVALAVSTIGALRPTAPPVVSKLASACSVVSRAEIEAALGRGLTLSTEETHGAASTCDYTAGNALLSITVEHVPADIDVPSEMRALQAAFPGATIREISRLGTRAFFVDLGDSGTQLHVIRGTRDHLMITVLGFGNASEVSNVAERLARRAGQS